MRHFCLPRQTAERSIVNNTQINNPDTKKTIARGPSIAIPGYAKWKAAPKSVAAQIEGNKCLIMISQHCLPKLARHVRDIRSLSVTPVAVGPVGGTLAKRVPKSMCTRQSFSDRGTPVVAGETRRANQVIKLARCLSHRG